MILTYSYLIVCDIIWKKHWNQISFLLSYSIEMVQENTLASFSAAAIHVSILVSS